MEETSPEKDLPEATGRSQTGEAGKGKTVIDLDAILLPKKEAPPSTERINAGVLLEQEQNATLLEPKAEVDEKIVWPRPVPLEEGPGRGDLRTFSKQLPPESDIPSLQTYKSDVQKLIQKGNVSVVTIAAAEAGRRGGAWDAAALGASGQPIKKIALIIGGILLTLGTLALIVFVVRPAPTVPVAEQAPAPFILVDATTLINFGSNTTHSWAMGSLQDAKTNATLSLGLVGRLLPTVSATPEDTKNPMDAQTFLALIAPTVPADLLRAVQPAFLLGLHSFGQNQPFLILKVDSYEQAYSGMLAWEGTMHQDLSPLFDYTPRQRIPEEQVAATTSMLRLLPAAFADRTVANHDARVLQNSAGDIYFLWTFLNRNTIAITTQENTLREIISRATEAPIVPLPQ